MRQLDFSGASSVCNGSVKVCFEKRVFSQRLKDFMGVSGLSDAGSVSTLQHYQTRQINLANHLLEKKQREGWKREPSLNTSPMCVDGLLAPIKNKMGVLKKIKRKISRAPKSSNSGTNNLPPILFHEVCGENIRICQNGAVAKRVESFCKGITFSSRPIKINEKVLLRFVEISNNWSGVIRFGFTSNDPATLKDGLPKFACPDLTKKPGYWAKALPERLAGQDSIMYFSVTATGEVHYGINGVDFGCFIVGVETRGPLWAVVDVYGNSTVVELLDHWHSLNNSRVQLNNARRTPVSVDSVDRLIMPMSQVALETAANDVDADITSPRFQPAGAHFQRLAFHRTCGKNVRLNADLTIAARCNPEYSQGYVFTGRPVELGERIVVQVLNTDSSYMGALAFGLTSCNPAHLQSSDLPDDADMLLDRNEYWVVNKDVASSPKRGEEITFCVTVNGEVQMSRNGGRPVVFMHVDQSLQLWAFFDVFGSTQKIRMLGSMLVPSRATPPQPARGLHVSLPPPPAPTPTTSSDSHHHHSYCQQVPAAPVLAPPVPVSVPPPVLAPVATQVPAQVPAQLVQLQAAPGGGTMLVVNLPPAHNNYLNHQPPVPSRSSPPDVHLYRHNQRERPSASSDPSQPSSSGTLLSTYSHTYIEPVSSSSSYSTIDGPSQAWTDAANLNTMGRGSECSICYERHVDSVLYMCGHMCMCYQCAVQQWKGKGGGHCPLCRAPIRDVIRTYKS